MDPVALLKALLMHAAYEGACAVCEPLISNPDGTQVHQLTTSGRNQTPVWGK